MFNIDKQSLSTAIAISLEPNLLQVEDKRSVHIQYFHVVLDVIVGVMNSKFRNIDDAFEEQLDLYPTDCNLPLLGEVIRDLVMDIKLQFMQAGFDQRLKYKLYTRNIHQLKLYAIGMDLDATVTAYVETLPDTLSGDTDDELLNIVSEEPTIDQLNAAYVW